MKIALAQINPIIGDFDYNVKKILNNVEAASKQGADLVIFSELVLCGYPPKDLLLKKQFIEDNKKNLEQLAKNIKSDISIIVGFAEENHGEGKPLFDSLALIQGNKIICTRQKVLLPTYDVFDEDRYFEQGEIIKSVEIHDKQFGFSICEDIWHDDLTWTKPRYHVDPIGELVKQKIDFLINSSASPYFIGKPKIRENVLRNAAKKYKVPIIYVNQTGGNDELIFDGNSCVIDKDGNVCLKLKSFQEDLQVFEYNKNKQITAGRSVPTELPFNDMQELLQAITCGLHDYVTKCGFKKVIIGLSGGIDSALVATLATFALGKENVQGVFMPSRYTSNASYTDAKELASNLGIDIKTIPIEESFKTFLNLLSPIWGSVDSSLTQENIQPRIRGLILMAISNQSGALVLSTGNKSELATGYCTLYGDMCGGLSVISDLPKTTVYKLAKYINQKEGKNLIPNNTIIRPPTAELKPNQTDQDTLPPYDLLDQILNAYVEEHLPLKEIIKNGITKETAQKVCNMIDKSEYKREQAAPGLKLTSRSFGYGWRMPIAQRYKETI
ncbi:MAG: NAD+ synthase [Candidatus Melainabacteria bacterium]|nr:NAD+ synthase [Candidatus Melainabacteria bacterium]